MKILKKINKGQNGLKIEDPEVIDYFKSYVSSPGFERILQNQKKWWEERHPYQKWINPNGYKWAEILQRTMMDPNLKILKDERLPIDSSVAIPGTKTAIIGLKEGEKYDQYNINNYDSIVGHELNHLVSPHNIGGAQKEILGTTIIKPVTKNGKLREGAINHDYTLEELQADVWGIKNLLRKEGIYDSRSPEDITKDQVKKLRDKYPNERFFYNYDSDEKAAKILNLVAQSNSNNNQEMPFAKNGIKIKPGFLTRKK